MSERSLPTFVDPSARFPNWGAIWAGTFSFLAIWVVFGLLGAALFASLAAPSSAALGGMSVGIGIWAVVLTIVAMFVGGRAAVRFAGISDRMDAMLHGMAVFGLSFVCAMVLFVLGELGMGTLYTAATSASVVGTFATLGWTGFVALLLGWIAAMAGASSAVQRKRAEAAPEQVRRVA